MEDLHDEALLMSYKKAKELNLDKDFIRLLEEELEKRNLEKEKKSV